MDDYAYRFSMREILRQSWPRSRKKVWEVVLTVVLAQILSNGWAAGAIALVLLLGISIYDFFSVRSESKAKTPQLALPQNYQKTDKLSDGQFNGLIISLGLLMLIGATYCAWQAIKIKELQSRQQSPIYQQQLILGNRLNSFSKQCRYLASRYDANAGSIEVVSGQSELRIRLENLDKDLVESGIGTMELRRVLNEENSKPFNGDSWRRIANECEKIFKQLPQ